MRSELIDLIGLKKVSRPRDTIHTAGVPTLYLPPPSRPRYLQVGPAWAT